jgi:poly-beta-1,6-N-acetyl-D-glucosamine biosynthesis protein PgaD
MLRTTAFVTCALTIAGGSWYIAVNLTTASDLTAIYNCSAFFAYAFSIPLLKEKIRGSKVTAVAIAIAGVMVVAYGGEKAEKGGGKSGGAVGGGPEDSHGHNYNYRFMGNLIIGVGSILYGFYEVLYKRVACPPDDTSPGRGMIFANAFGSMIGVFTLAFLWIPLPILHYMGWETFQLPRGEQAYMMAISVFSNAGKLRCNLNSTHLSLSFWQTVANNGVSTVFSGSFLILISLTSPVLSSVAALLTIFIVALVDQLLFNSPLSGAAVTGGMLIIFAFTLLSWATYKEMGEEKKRRYSVGEVTESDIEQESGI